jgi:hypothetical protein
MTVRLTRHAQAGKYRPLSGQKPSYQPKRLSGQQEATDTRLPAHPEYPGPKSKCAFLRRKTCRYWQQFSNNWITLMWMRFKCCGSSVRAMSAGSRPVNISMQEGCHTKYQTSITYKRDYSSPKKQPLRFVSNSKTKRFLN